MEDQHIQQQSQVDKSNSPGAKFASTSAEIITRLVTTSTANTSLESTHTHALEIRLRDPPPSPQSPGHHLLVSLFQPQMNRLTAFGVFEKNDKSA